jgi:predicted nucleotide-binding protein (sugar kinase/HSP70/actin superfamily)
MPMRIGIPRALFYYRYYPLWNTFFTEIGAELVVSPPTTRKILDLGVKHCVDEACLPVKVFHGHVLSIASVSDMLFIPRFTSVSKKEYICPKFGGLPDMVRNTLGNLPPIISTEVNLIRSRKNSFKAALEAGKEICGDMGRIKRAFVKAMAFYRQSREEMKNRIAALDKGRKKILLLGHPYIVYDSGINMGIVDKLKKYGLEVVTLEMFDTGQLRKKTEELSKPMFWNYGAVALGCVIHVIENGGFEGIIHITSFGCGIDSFVNDLAERRTRRSSDIPYMAMNIDEHTGEVGFDTRLEAFVDMLKWRGKSDRHVPAFG